MNKDQAKGSFQKMKGSLKEKWGKLTDDEITESKGQKDYLVGKVQERYGKSKDDAIKEVNGFFKANSPNEKSEAQAKIN